MNYQLTSRINYALIEHLNMVLVDVGLVNGNLKNFPYIPISEREYP